MADKMKQISDNIHGTIYLSDLEAELISTPYFYRLHDIYQSSTVYMTFPTNRTKRYEHSLGTMDLAGSMLFSSLSNAENDTKTAFFKTLQDRYNKIINLVVFREGNVSAPYYTKCEQHINHFLGNPKKRTTKEKRIESITESLKKSVSNGCFQDAALDNFQIYPMNEQLDHEHEDSALMFFLYRCTLQAIRIVGLFHDVGHPPYSHIIEDELESLYEEIEKDINNGTTEQWNDERINEFVSILKPYITKDPNEAYKCETLLCNKSSVLAKVHERIGLYLLQSAMTDVIVKFIERISRTSKDKEEIISEILYYILIMEFSIAIVTEKDMFFASLHKIIDGTIDADRLDYIVRDSMNSSVDWGKIPYKRLINSCMLKHLGKDDGLYAPDDELPFIIAYPQKLIDDITDILVLRYKIFVRINFHHRCIKTANALRSAVRELAEDYLSKSEGESSITDEIEMLWTALDLSAGEKKIRIIQWNDSWLITVLHHALVELKSVRHAEQQILTEDLEEILLHKKRYSSLIKRGIDSKRIVNEVFKKTKLDDFIEEMEQEEWEKYYKSIIKGKKGIKDNGNETELANIREMIIRIRSLKRVKENGDMEMLETILPTEGNNGDGLTGIMNGALEKKKKAGLITDYKVYRNLDRRKNGISNTEDALDAIWIYNGDKKSKMDINMSLRPQLEGLEKNSPWIYVSFVMPKDGVKSLEDVSKELFDTLIDDLTVKLSESIESVFDKL